MKYADHLRKQVMASICDIRDIGKRQYVAYPELASTFCHSTTAKELGKKKYLTKMFSENGAEEGSVYYETFEAMAGVMRIRLFFDFARIPLVRYVYCEYDRQRCR